ncbi:MAG: RluA family pseudouridine synthase [Clostridia bacterium]|nr:RluA family pseudouridine synthase [Clostridia bacterium]
MTDNKEVFITEYIDSGKRLDLFLSEAVDFTRSRVAKLIEQGKVTINGCVPKKSGEKLGVGDVVEILLEPPKEISLEPENIDIDIVYEDESIVVVNKKRGMVVHPAGGSESGTLVNALLYHVKNLSGINGEIRPGIVHRLDKDTSGLLVVAKCDEAHLSLSRQLAERTCHRTYIALLEGNVKLDEGQIHAPIGRSRADRKKMAVVEGGRDALTDYKVVKRYGKYTLVKFFLHTGRTHQIRVHSKYINHPVVGDKAYNSNKDVLCADGQLLHAIKLEFTHPKSGEFVTFRTEIPEYFQNVLRKLGEIPEIE